MADMKIAIVVVTTTVVVRLYSTLSAPHLYPECIFQVAGEVTKAGMLLPGAKKSAVHVNEAAGSNVHIRVFHFLNYAESFNCCSTSADRRARIAMWNAERESGGQ